MIVAQEGPSPCPDTSPCPSGGGAKCAIAPTGRFALIDPTVAGTDTSLCTDTADFGEERVVEMLLPLGVLVLVLLVLLPVLLVDPDKVEARLRSNALAAALGEPAPCPSPCP